MDTTDSFQSPVDEAICALVRDATDGTAVLHVVGEIDLSNIGQLERALQDIAGDRPFVIDLTACTYMDSTGLRAIAVVHGKHPDAMRLVVPTNGSIRRIFDITGLATEFRALESLDQALNGAGAAPRTAG